MKKSYIYLSLLYIVITFAVNYFVQKLITAATIDEIAKANPDGGGSAFIAAAAISLIYSALFVPFFTVLITRIIYYFSRKKIDMIRPLNAVTHMLIGFLICWAWVWVALVLVNYSSSMASGSSMLSVSEVGTLGIASCGFAFLILGWNLVFAVVNKIRKILIKK